jgi:hypothetical protein
MRKSLLKKTSGAMSALLLVSILLPVLAFAGYSVTFKQDGTITGQVYGDATDVQAGLGKSSFTAADAVYVHVYGKSTDTQPLSIIKATYSLTVGGVVYFGLLSTDAIASTYGSVYLKTLFPNGTVLEPLSGGISRAGAIGGGNTPPTDGNGGGVTPPVNGTVADLGAATEISAAALTQLFTAGAEVTIRTTGDSVTLPASALVAAAGTEGASVTIETDEATYTLPLSVLDFDALATAVGGATGMTIEISMTVVTGEAAATVTTEVGEIEGAEQIGPAIDFTVTATGANGTTVEINDFGNTYVERSIKLADEVDPATTTVVVWDETAEELNFVPAIFEVVNDIQRATIFRNANSIYAVLSVDKADFTDVPANHWAAEDIELLSNKLIVAGVSAEQFDPNRNITRAEFARLVVRSLGLNNSTEEAEFSDVEGDEWYADEVATAAEAGLIFGYDDGTFRPTQTITRAELAAMVVRAMTFAGTDVELTTAEQAEALESFRDLNQVGAWAQDELAIAVSEGIVLGVGADRLAPNSNATRAEATAMLARYLVNVGFINDVDAAE